MPPGVAISPSASRTVVAAPQIRCGSTPSMVAGFPAFPTPTISPFLIPISALTIPSTGSMTRALDNSISSEPIALSCPGVSPNPSRSVLPPPCKHSSPGTPKSFSTSAISDVSPKRTASPTVGPYISAYFFRLIFAMTSRSLEVSFASPLERCTFVSFTVGGTICKSIKPVKLTGPAELGQWHLFILARFEADRCPRRYI